MIAAGGAEPDMAFPPGFLDELRARTVLSEVVGRRVNLVRKGREFTGLCPFHQEKTPSFWVNDEKGVYHCFGCGASGDSIEFVMRTEGLAFPDAVERLAGLAGLPVPETSPEERAAATRRNSVLEALEAATRWFQLQLQSEAGRAAVDYLKSRGVAGEAAARFRLGFAPDRRTALRDHLLKEGFQAELLSEAGLIGEPEGGGETFDRFRGRIIFPIADVRGRVIAFGGRALGEAKPKYLNSPETPLFHKSRVLYGLAQARKAAYDSGEIVVAEGYMDVIALSEAGFTAAVAPLGTALTEDHIRVLWRYAAEPILCFDGDEAGLRAAARAAERVLPLLKPGYSLRFAFLPQGEDPDSLLRTRGREAMREVLDKARPLVDQVWSMETTGRTFDTPERRARLEQRLRDVAGRIADATVRRHYRDAFFERGQRLFGRPAPRGPRAGRLASDNLRLSPGGRGRGFASAQGPALAPAPLPAGREGRGLRQRILLATLINHLSLLDEVAEELGSLGFADGQLDRLRQEIINVASLHPDIDSARLKAHLEERNLAAVVDRLLDPALYALAPFARPEAEEDEALGGWRHVLALVRRETAKGEIESAATALATDLTEDNWNRFLVRLEEGFAERLAAEVEDDLAGPGGKDRL